MKVCAVAQEWNDYNEAWSGYKRPRWWTRQWLFLVHQFGTVMVRRLSKLRHKMGGGGVMMVV